MSSSTSLYDRVVTFRLRSSNAAWKAIHEAEATLGTRAGWTPSGSWARRASSRRASRISEKEASDQSIAGAFQEVKPGQKPRAGRPKSKQVG